MAGLVEIKRLTEGFKSLSEKFLEMSDKNLQYVFYAIIALGIVAFVTWILTLFAKDTETEPLETVEITWSNFRAKLGENVDLVLILIASFVIFAYVGEIGRASCRERV